MRFRAITAALAAAGVLFVGGAAPAFAHNGGVKCGNNACIQVWNSYQGSDYITGIYLWDQTNAAIWNTPCWTLSGFGVQGCQYGFGGATWTPNRSYRPGRCISGFISGLSGQAPCWIVP
jgi:hypothetical protein